MRAKTLTDPGKTLLTSRQLADALGVSESSLKRWADVGDVVAVRTGGGHRRFHLRDAMAFARTRGLRLDPASLGLATPLRDDELVEAIIDGRSDEALAAAMAHVAAGESIAALGDGPIRRALAQVGERWQHAPDGIYIEHRATALCQAMIALVRGLLPPSNGPVAVGGAAPQDPYGLPSALCAASLHELGVRAIDLGADTPAQTLVCAAIAERATWVWVSVSAPPAPSTTAALVAAAMELRGLGIRLMLGGRNAAGIAAMTNIAALTGCGDLAPIIDP